MPLYEYKCEKCENEFEELFSFSEREKPTNEPCSSCEGKIRLKMSKGAYHSKDVVYKDPYGQVAQFAQRSFGKRMTDMVEPSDILFTKEDKKNINDVVCHDDPITNPKRIRKL